MQAFELHELASRRAESAGRYLEFLRVPALSCGLYVLEAGSVDPQQPHSEDEIYVVMGGRAQIRVADQDRPVAAGSIVYVAAGVEHRFHTIEEALEVLVIFAPGEYSQAPASSAGQKR